LNVFCLALPILAYSIAGYSCAPSPPGSDEDSEYYYDQAGSSASADSRLMARQRLMQLTRDANRNARLCLSEFQHRDSSLENRPFYSECCEATIIELKEAEFYARSVGFIQEAKHIHLRIENLRSYLKAAI